MYLGAEESLQLATNLRALEVPEDAIVAVFPSALATVGVHAVLQDHPFLIGAQHVAHVPKGAYTGDISAAMFQEVGCVYALVGHSEQRYVHKEDDEEVRRQVESCLEVGLVPVLCVGETKQDREEQKTEFRLTEQLTAALSGLVLSPEKNVIVAYEPVWAIGTHEACDPEEVSKIHVLIERLCTTLTGHTPIVIYGGSVDEKNVLSYVEQPYVGGVLVGGASVHADRFATLLQIVTDHLSE